MYRTVTIKAGSGGWGGPLTITPTETCNKVLSVTGGGIHPVAQKIADMTGAEVIDGFKTTVPDGEIIVAVVDCGGTARCGVYPKKGIYTVNVEPVGKAGPLAKFITPEIYVSAVSEKDIVGSGDNRRVYKTITIRAGSGGWGGPLTITPTETCNKVLSVTGGGIHPVAQRIANMTGAEVVDGFKTTLPDGEIIVAVVDCGGTARCGVYPKKGIYTVNVEPVGKAGPLAKFITPEIYVSAVKESDIIESDYMGHEMGTSASRAEEAPQPGAPKTKEQAKREIAEANKGKNENIVVRIGKVVGRFVNIFFQAGRDTMEMVIGTILPFMAFTATLLGIISASGLGNVIANTISPLCSTLPGMIVIAFICGIPILSPVLGPGAVIAQVVGTLLGAEFAAGHIPPQYALPALFAIDAQAGCDFVPVGLSLGEAEPETIEYGVPAVLFERLVTGPLAVLIAFVFSIGMY